MNGEISDAANLAETLTTKFQHSRRVVVAVAGAPASGKSTLAENLVNALNTSKTTVAPHAAILPMDGYHLDNEILDKNGWRARKGAPHTFDVTSFIDAVKSLKDQSEVLRFPAFDRTSDAIVPNANTISTKTKFVIVEGNDLLMQDKPWCDLLKLFDIKIFLDTSELTLRNRLLQRWLDNGYSLDEATEKAEQNDLPNARTVIENSSKADISISNG